MKPLSSGFFSRVITVAAFGMLLGCSEKSAINTLDTASVTNEATHSDASATSAAPEVFIPQRADPFIHRTEQGHYYFIATSPLFDQIQLRGAETLKGLAAAPEKTIWKKYETGPMSVNIWAPELHYFDDAWYIYFAAGDVAVPGSIRMYVLENKNQNPLEGEWTELGRVETARDSFSLDATVFSHNNQRYLVWAQRDAEGKYNSAMYIAHLLTPTTLGSVETLITEPEFDWEVQGYKVNEGAAVIKRNGKIFIAYSGSATDHRYAMGLIWADENADLLDPAVWQKSPKPLFYTNEDLQRFGPGHNSFTLLDDGKTDVMVYHARTSQSLDGSPLSDPNRHAFIRRLQWDEQGFPEFGQDRGDDLP